METCSALLAICAGNSPVPGEFPTQRPLTRSFDVFFDLRPNKRLSKHWWGWWFETPSYTLWRHCNVTNCIESSYWSLRFASKLVETYMSMKIDKLWQYLRCLLQRFNKVYGRPSLLYSPGQPTFSEVLILPIINTKGSLTHLCWSYSAGSHRCMQPTISNLRTWDPKTEQCFQ